MARRRHVPEPHLPPGHPAATDRCALGDLAEFVEAGLLREYRRTHDVKLSKLRTVIDRLREEYGTRYPLAHHRPYIAGRQLLLEVEQDAGLDAEFCLVAVANDQLLLTPAAESFVKRVEWTDDIAVSWRPHDDPLLPRPHVA